MRAMDIILMKDPRGSYTMDEMKAMIAMAQPRSYRDYALLTMLTWSGRRVGEIVRPLLRVKDIDFESNRIYWTIEKQFDRKTGKRRVFVIPEMQPVMDILAEHIEKEKLIDDDFLFDICPTRVWQIVKRYNKLAGITGKVRIVHAFRHGYYIFRAKTSKNPLDILKLNRRACHPDIATTMWYFRYANPEDQEEMEDLYNKTMQTTESTSFQPGSATTTDV